MPRASRLLVLVGLIPLLTTFSIQESSAECVGDADHNSAVSLSELQQSVDNFLGGCSGPNSHVVPGWPCGDAILESGEQCELGTLNGATCVGRGFFEGTLGCLPGTCTFDTSGCRAWGRVFVTSSTYTAAGIGGLDGGDTKCQDHATSAGLSGSWKAWLSTSTVDAKDRIPNVGYRLVDGTTVVATSRADLLDGSIAASISKDQTGNVRDVTGVFTGTLSDGTKSLSGDVVLTCVDWTSNVVYPADFGYSNSTTNWTSAGGAVANCSFPLAIYCFEQLPSM